MIVKKLEELHEGAIGERGMFTHYNDNGKKEATYQRLPFDWEAHLKGENILDFHQLKLLKMELGAKGSVFGS